MLRFALLRHLSSLACGFAYRTLGLLLPSVQCLSWQQWRVSTCMMLDLTNYHNPPCAAVTLVAKRCRGQGLPQRFVLEALSQLLVLSFPAGLYANSIASFRDWHIRMEHLQTGRLYGMHSAAMCAQVSRVV
jgi:hypothetical protein